MNPEPEIGLLARKHRSFMAHRFESNAGGYIGQKCYLSGSGIYECTFAFYLSTDICARFFIVGSFLGWPELDVHLLRAAGFKKKVLVSLALQTDVPDRCQKIKKDMLLHVSCILHSHLDNVVFPRGDLIFLIHDELYTPCLGDGSIENLLSLYALPLDVGGEGEFDSGPCLLILR